MISTARNALMRAAPVIVRTNIMLLLPVETARTNDSEDIIRI